VFSADRTLKVQALDAEVVRPVSTSVTGSMGHCKVMCTGCTGTCIVANLLMTKAPDPDSW